MRYKAKAEYAPGKDPVVADALSRSPIQINPSSLVYHMHMVESKLPMSPQKKAELRSSTMDDATLQSVIIHTLTGWPNYEKDVPGSVKAFFNVRSLLSISSGFLTYTDRIVIPHTLEAGEDSHRSSGNNEVSGRSQGVRVVARDNARHHAHSGSLRTLSSPQTESTVGATDDNSSTHRTMAESSNGPMFVSRKRLYGSFQGG